MKVHFIIYSIFIISLFSCGRKCYIKKDNLYYIHHTKVEYDNKTFLCNPDLVKKVNTNWLLHGKYHCHYYNSFVQTFPEKYGECVKRVSKMDIIELLGKPNEDENGKIEYLISRNCNKNMLNFGILSFTFSENQKITGVNFTVQNTKS